MFVRATVGCLYPVGPEKPRTMNPLVFLPSRRISKTLSSSFRGGVADAATEVQMTQDEEVAESVLLPPPAARAARPNYVSRGPPSPASTTAQEDILRLRSLLDTERSRRVAAESALGGAGAAPTSSSRPRNGSGACTPTSMGGTPRSRSYSGLHKSAMARAVEAHALGGTSTPKSHHGGCVGGGGGMGLGTPSNSFGNLANMGGTPRAPRLSYSALQKFPSARTVEAHALEAAANGARWVQTAFAKASGGGGEKKEELRRASVRRMIAGGYCRRAVHGMPGVEVAWIGFREGRCFFHFFFAMFFVRGWRRLQAERGRRSRSRAMLKRPRRVARSSLPGWIGWRRNRQKPFRQISRYVMCRGDEG